MRSSSTKHTLALAIWPEPFYARNGNAGREKCCLFCSIERAHGVVHRQVGDHSSPSFGNQQSSGRAFARGQMPYRFGKRVRGKEVFSLPCSCLALCWRMSWLIRSWFVCENHHLVSLWRDLQHRTGSTRLGCHTRNLLPLLPKSERLSAFLFAICPHISIFHVIICMY